MFSKWKEGNYWGASSAASDVELEDPLDAGVEVDVPPVLGALSVPEGLLDAPGEVLDGVAAVTIG